MKRDDGIHLPPLSEKTFDPLLKPDQVMSMLKNKDIEVKLRVSNVQLEGFRKLVRACTQMKGYSCSSNYLEKDQPDK